MTGTPLPDTAFAARLDALGPFEPAPRLAVAVSGGADSLALALLAHTWAAARDGTVHAVTVDHGLRPEAADEAATAGARLGRHGIPHTILRRTAPLPRGGVQAAARQHRHALLEAFCHQEGILHLLLAHHRGDQAETFLGRLARGSGAFGLAAMAAVSEGAHARWLRPLLDVSGDSLRATLRARGEGWAEDPTNRDTAHQRVRLRNALRPLADEGLRPADIAATAGRLGTARAALEADTAGVLAAAATPRPGGALTLLPGPVTGAADEVALRALGRMLAHGGGTAHPPRADRLERLLAALRAGRAAGRTAGGCRFMAAPGGVLRLVREAGRIRECPAVGPGALVTWDGRFRVRVGAAGRLPPGPWHLAPLGGAGRDAFPDLPAAARAALPALAGGDGACVAPVLRYDGLRDYPEDRPPLLAEPAPRTPLTAAPFGAAPLSFGDDAPCHGERERPAHMER